MGMWPGNQAITGGTVLRTPAIQSPDYVPGVSGWIIRQDGSAEFNDGTFRGSIEVGPNPGEHFIVNNPATGDVIDVYDSSNNLVLSVDQFGQIQSFNIGSGSVAEITGGLIQFNNVPGNGPFGVGAGLVFSSGSATQGQFTMRSGLPAGALAESGITLFADTNTNNTQIEAGQFNITGNLVQTDQPGGKGSGNLTHRARYSGTVAGGAGLVTFSHGCSFTPVGGVAAPLTNFSQYNWSDAFGTHGFSATQAQIMPFFPGGASLGNGQVITFYAEFWG